MRLVASLALTVVATAFAVVIAGRSTVTAPAFLRAPIGAEGGDARYEPTSGIDVELGRSGYVVRGASGEIALASEDAAGGDWRHFERGAVRSTRFGSETVVVTATRTEQFLGIDERQGTRTWRWRLDPGTSVPRLRTDGSVSLAGADSAGLRIAPVRILDGRGRAVTPRGLRWGLDRSAGTWYLTLALDDSTLPLPYVIDPAVDYTGPLYLTSTAATLTGVTDDRRIQTTAPAAGSSTTQTRFTTGATGYIQRDPLTLNQTVAAPSTSPNGIGWVVDQNIGSTGFPSGNWSFTLKSSHGGAAGGVGVWTVAVWRGTVSGTTFTCTAPCATSVSAGGGTVIAPTDDPAAANIVAGASPATDTVTITGVPKFTLAANETLWVQFWHHQTTGYSGGNNAARTSSFFVNDGISLITPGTPDDVAPTHSLSVAEGTNPGGQHFDSTNRRVYYNPAAGGDFTVTDALADGGSGPYSVDFPAIAATGFTHSAKTDTAAPFTSNTYSWTTASAAAPGASTLTGEDLALQTSTTTLNFVRDVTAPAGGALTVNSVAATGGGSQSYDTDGTFTIGTRTDHAEAMDASGSGLASSTLTREAGTLSADTCSSYGAPTTLVGAPAQSGLATGCYRYVLTGTDNVGNSVSLTTVVKVDTSDPSAPSLTLSDSSADVHTTGTTAYYRPAGSGSFDVTASSTDAHTDIASYTFPTLAGFTTSGGGASRTYTLSTPTEGDGGKTVTATNNAGRTNNSTFTLTADSTAPVSGALTANGVAATGGGTQSYDGDGSFTIGLRTDWTDAGAGIVSSILTREDGTLSADACSAYGAPATLVGTPAQSGLGTGCYRYTLTGTDNVGNAISITTEVKVDLSDPSAPSLTLSDSSADVHTTGTTAYYRPAGSGSFDVTASSSDGQSGIATYGFPALAGFTPSGSGATRTYALNTPTEADGAKSISAQNNAGRSASSTFALTADSATPTGGALTVNGVAASGGGSQSYDLDGTFTIGSRTDYTDGGSGLASSTLTREDGTLSANVCSAYGAPTTLVGTPAQSGLVTGCYRYVLTGADNVGNSVAVTTVVKVDTSDPSAPSLTLSESSADVHTTGTTAYYRPAGSGSFDVTASSSDADSGIASYTFPTLTGFTASGSGATKTFTLATPTESDGDKTVSVQNTAGRTNSSTFTLTADGVDPNGGVLTVNGTAATLAGSESYDPDGAFPIDTRVDWTDTLSGIASSTLTRENGTLSAGACASYGAPTALGGAPAQSGLTNGCYRFTLTGVDNVGNTISRSTVVKVDLTAPSAPGLTLANPSGAVHLVGTTAFYRPSGSGSFDVTADSTDLQSGIAAYTFPALAGFIASGSGATKTYTLNTPTEPDGPKNVTAENPAGLTSSSDFTLTADSTQPGGGSVTANSGAPYDTDGVVTLSKVDFADGGSGIASQALTRASAPLANDSCGAFTGSDPITISGGNDADTLATACYRYTLAASDNVGNQASSQSTIVKVDTSAPTAPTLTFSNTTGDTYYSGSGSTVWFRSAAGAGGSFDVDAPSVDGQSGVASYSFPALGAGWSQSGTGSNRTYTFADAAAEPGSKSVTATNGAGTTSADGTFTVSSDSTDPVGGSVTANGGAAYDTDGVVALATSNFTDADSGLASQTLTRAGAPLTDDSCGAFTGSDPVTISGGNDADTLVDGCYRYTLTGTDQVGNVDSVTTVVKVDSGSVTSSVDAASLYSGTSISLPYSASDGGSGLDEVELWAKGPSDGAYALVATDTSPASPSFSYTASQGEGVYRFYSVARDVAGNTEAVPASPPDTQTTVDLTKPSSAADALPAYTASIPLTIGYSSSDALSGVDQVELWARGPADGAYALVATDTTPGTPSFSYTAAQGHGLYRFSTRARDVLGNYEDAPGAPDTQTVFDATPPSDPSLSFGSFTNASATGTTVFVREGAAGGFTVTSDSDDPESGIDNHLFPTPGGSWTGGGPVAADPAAMAYTFTASDTAPAGPHVVLVTNGIGANNAGTSSFTVVADTAAPTTSSTCNGAACSAGWYTSVPVSVVLSANDAGAGVQQIRYTTDGSDPTILTGAAYLAPVDLSAEGTTTVKFRAFDLVGNAETVQALQVRIDTVPPDTTLDSGPSGAIVDTSATFTFSSSDTGASFECKLDGGSFAACSSPESYTGLVDGLHTFQVRAVDQAGSPDPTPATRSWTIDTVTPDTSITSAPLASTNATGATFAFLADDGGPTFECKLDGGSFQSCTSPQTYSSLAEGSHTFSVRAVDAALNTDPTPATHTWTVDTVAPDTSIVSAPSDPSASATPTFSFDSTESPVTYEVDLDGAGWVAAATPLTLAPALGDGSHTLQVRSSDAAGNQDASAASFTWAVDATAPTGSLTAPAGGSAVSGGAVALTADSADALSGVLHALFERSPAGAGTWTTIGSADTNAPYGVTWDTTAIADGDYDLRVTTRDVAGNQFVSALVTVPVDNTAPSLSVSAPNPVNLTAADPATVSATASDGGTGIASVGFEQCSETSPACTSDSWVSLGVDAAAPYSVAWPIPADGTRLLRVRAIDGAGRQTTELVLVTVDRTRPSGSLTAPAAGADLRGASVALTATAGDAAPGSVNTVTFQRSPAGAGTWTDVSTDSAPPYAATLDTIGLTDGLYDLRVFTTDAAGNAEAAPATLQVRVDNTDPTGSVTTPAAAADVRGTIALASDSADGGSGIASVQFQRSPAGAGSWTTQAASWNTTLVADGQYDLRVITTDDAGNSFTSAAITVRVDNTDPTGSVTSPASAANVRGTVALASDSADTGSGVAIVQFQRSPAGLGAWSIQAPSWNTTLVGDGQYDVRVITTDGAGNTSTSASITIRVDNTDPSGDVTAPADGVEIGVLPVALTSNSADSGSGVDTVVFERRPAGSGGAWTATPTTWDTASGPDAVADGSYELRVTTTDVAGNSFSSAFVTVLVDHTAPVTSASLAPGTPSNAPVTVSFSAGDGAGSGVGSTTYTVDGGSQQQGLAVVIGAPGDHSNDGTHVVEYFSTDDVGNAEAPKTVTVVIDTTAPSGSAGDPGDYLRGIATLTYSTAAGDVSSVQFQFSPAGAGAWSNIGAADLTPPYEASWSTTLVADGPYDLRAVVTDSTGNVADELLPGLPKTVDNAAPSGAVTAPAAAAFVSGSVDVTASATDGIVPPASGVSAVRFEVKPAGAGTFSPFGTQTTPIVGSTYRQALATGALADGAAELRVVVTDVAGNETTSATRSVTIDNNAPTVTLDDPGAAITGAVTLNANASADTVQVVFEHSAAGAGSWTVIDTDVTPGDGFSADLAAGPLGDGLYDLRARATDSAGNSTSALRTTRVDNTLPTGSITAPAVSAIIGGPAVNLAATAADAGSGVVSVAFQVKPLGSGSFVVVATDTSAPYQATWDSTSAPDGTAEIRAIVTDAAGNARVLAVVPVTIDSTGPTATLADPGAVVSGTVALSAAAGGAAARVTFEVSPAGAGTWTEIGSDPNAPFGASFDTTTRPDDLYDLRAIGYDALDNASAPSVRANVRVDNTAPQLVSSAPEDGSVSVSANQIVLTASEAVTAPGATLDGAPAPAPTAVGSTLTFSTGALGDGLHVLAGELEDAAGLRTRFRVAVTVESTPSADPPPVERSLTSSGDWTLTVPGGLVTVRVPQAAWPTPPTPQDFILVLRVDAGPSSAAGPGFAPGTRVVDVTARWALAGTSVTEFHAPIEIIFVNPTGAPAIPAWSANGTSAWNRMSFLSGATLPAPQRDGFFRDAAGVHVLTRHLTHFGLLLDDEPPTPPVHLAGVVERDGLTIRWVPGSDSSGQLGDVLLFVNGQDYRFYGPTEYEAKLGAFSASDTRTFTLVQLDAAGNRSGHTQALRAVPQVFGRSLENAAVALETAGFSVGTVREETNALHAPGTVIGPSKVRLAVASTPIDLVVARAPGTAPQTRLVFSVTGAKKLALGKPTTIGMRIKVSRPARVTAVLFGAKKQRLYSWRLKVKAGATVVKLRLPGQIRRPGRYTISLVAHAGTETVRRVVTIRLTGPALQQVDPAKQNIEVVLAGKGSAKDLLMPGPVARGVRVLAQSGPDEVFALAASPARNVRIVVADVDEYGVVLIGDLHTVFPSLRLIALAEERSTRTRAIRAGAVLALPRSTPPAQLAKAIARISGR